MKVVITIITPNDARYPRHQLDPTLPCILPLPIIEVSCSPASIDEKVGFERCVPDSEMPNEGEGRGVGEDDEKEEELDWISGLAGASGSRRTKRKEKEGKV